MAFLVGLVAASAMASNACVEKIDTDPPGTGASGGSGGGGEGGSGAGTPGSGSLFESGSRLSATYVDGGDGAERLVGFHDGDLDLACEFTTVDGGGIKCVPSHMVTVMYADAACTEPVIVQRACDTTPPAHVSASGPVGCATDTLPEREVYTIGAENAATTVYQSGLGGCVADATFDADNDTVFDIAAADLSLFVDGTLGAGELDGGLGQRVVTTEDGARQVLGAYNVARDENCQARVVGESTLCLSPHLAYTAGFSTSATCDTEDVAYDFSEPGCGTPQAVLKTTPAEDQCEPATTTVHALSDALDAANVYEDDGGSCAATSHLEYSYYAIGGEASDGVLPALATAAIGTGRLTQSVVTTPEGAAVAYAGVQFQDTERDEVCTTRATDEGNRCLPTTLRTLGLIGGYFSDDACTTRLVDVTASVCAAEPPSLVSLYNEASAGVCTAPSLASIYELGAEHTGAVYQDNGTGCAEALAEGINFYELGAAVPLTNFAAVEVVTAPATQDE